MKNKKIIVSVIVFVVLGVIILGYFLYNKNKIEHVSDDVNMVAFEDAKTAFNSGDFNKSIALSAEQLKDDRNNVVFLSTYAISLLQKGSAEFNEDEYGKKGLEIANKIIQLDPQYKEGYFIKGYAYEITKEYDSAIKTYKQYLEIEKDAKVLNQMGHVYDLMGKNSDAIKFYQQAEELDSDNPRVKVNLARTHLANGNFDEAETLLNDAVKSDELVANHNISEAYSLLGEIALEKGLIDKANAFHKRALEINPNDVSALIGFGWTKFLVTRNDVSGMTEEEASKDSFVNEFVKNIEEAEQSIQKAFELYPNKSAAYYYLGAIYELTNREQQSQEMFKKALKVLNDDITLMKDERIEFKEEIESKLENKISIFLDKVQSFFIQNTYAVEGTGWWTWVITEQLRTGEIDASDFSGGYFHCANGANFAYNLPSISTQNNSSSSGGGAPACTTCECRGTCPGQCSTNANSNYEWTVTSPTIPLCSAGSPSPSTVSFPTGKYGEESKVDWTCDYHTAVNCSAQRENLCGTAAMEFDKHYAAPDEWNNATSTSGYFCKDDTILTPSSPLPMFPMPGEVTSWRCNDVNGNGSECSATNTTPAPECPVWGDGDESYTKEELEVMNEKELCGEFGLIKQSTYFVVNDIYWDWTCAVDTDVIPSGYIGNPEEFFKGCRAKNCLANTDFNEELYVYFKEDGTVDPAKFFIDSACPDLCCVYSNESSGESVSIGECDSNNLSDGEIVVDGHPDEIEKICTTKYTGDDGDDHSGDVGGICEEIDISTGEIPDECQDSLTIQCVCTANRCTAQGSCVATPVFASSIADANCSSECSSDSDCGGGGSITERN